MSTCFTNCTYYSDSYSSYVISFFDYSGLLATVTHDPNAVFDWILEVEYVHRRRLNRLIVGLDVEWRANFISGQHRYPVATLQLCVGRHCLIYQIQHTRYVPQALADFFSNYSYTFVGVGQDLDKLKNDYGIGGEAYSVELSRVAAEQYNQKELMNAGLKKLGGMVVGVEMDKPKKVKLSMWDNRRLSQKQVQYVALDAFLSFEVGRIFNACDY